MKGGKLIVIFLLLALAAAQWIQEVPKKEQPIPVSQPKVEQLSTKEPVQLTITEVHPHQGTPIINQQPIITEEIQIAPVVPIPEPIQENPTPIFPEYQDNLPDHERQEPPHHRQKKNKHKKGKHHNHRQDVATVSSVQEQNEGFLEMLMNNSTLLWVVLGVIGLVLIKVGIKSGKCNNRRVCRPINPVRQVINMTPQVQNTEIDAIEETIRYHEAQIMKLRNSAYYMQPAYMPYQ